MDISIRNTKRLPFNNLTLLNKFFLLNLYFEKSTDWSTFAFYKLHELLLYLI